VYIVLDLMNEEWRRARKTLALYCMDGTP